ncbi:MAG: tail protein X [Zoogloeaceae bacterium]|jgi:phage tail protein X|nr:tail protein X [Zoogloeaceae bacterium]
MIARANANETLDALCWRVLGRTAGVVEAALELNPGLALDALLPEGKAVRLPDPADAPPPEKNLIQLWD